jgi:hypothetical protein
MTDRLAWYWYVAMLPLALPAIVAVGYVINAILEMGGA